MNILGGKSAFSNVNLMTAVIIHIRCLPGRSDSKNALIFMLETLFSKIELEERKRILEKECGMIMTVELERRIQTMCNISEVIIEQGIERGIKQERINAIGRMLNANATKEQILSYGYTEDEFSKAENLLYV